MCQNQEREPEPDSQKPQLRHDEPLTTYTDDTQIGQFALHPEGTHLAYANLRPR